jgi:lipoprotein NlpD
MNFLWLFVVVALVGCGVNNQQPHTLEVITAIAESSDTNVYVVKPKDTVYSIAWAYNVDVFKINQLNNLNNNSKLLVGQKLILPNSPVDIVYNGSVPLIITKSTHKVYSVVDKKVVDKDIVLSEKNKIAFVNKKPINHRFKHVNTLGKSRNIALKNWHWPKNKYWYAKSPWHGVWVRDKSVKAMSDGVVVYNGDGIKGYGHLIILKHPKGILSAYGNVSKSSVVVGKNVKKGQVIAGVKNKFYLEVRVGGEAIDLHRYL